MAGKAAELRGQVRVSDYLSVGLLSCLVPPSLVDEALTAHNRHSKRQRDLPAHAVAYYVMALSLYRGVNTEEVLRVVTEGMDYLGDAAIRRKVGKSAISASRTRLGAEVMRTIAERALAPLAQSQMPGAFYRGLRVVSVDGTTLEVADEAGNREAFGVPGTQQGQTGYPQIRCVGLLEALQNLKPDMLCLADRGFSGYPLWQTASQTGAQLLWRIPRNRRLPALQRFKDGSYLSQINPSPATLKKMSDKTAPVITVRVIDYRLPGVADAEPVYRLITTLLDAKRYPADELAALYHGRWRIETTFAEIKTTLKGADIVLRSKTPELVRQEFWGLLLAHHVVRKLMWEAALSRQRTPDLLSFKHSLTLIRRKLPSSGAIPPRTVPEVVASVD